MLADVVQGAAELATKYVTDGRYPPVAVDVVQSAVLAVTPSELKLDFLVRCLFAHLAIVVHLRTLLECSGCSEAN